MVPAHAKAWRDSGPAEHRDGVAVLADGAYINTGLIVPHRKRPMNLPHPDPLTAPVRDRRPTLGA
ncbi:hypothetical protein A8W25_14660 [Streptomyces sp. ERV7]|uniref:hypothetical protein n=1 Tax=Streptomyces sp. ERV7 TaxID=1322334 RepID=UPI0007F53FD3|nr:hypothetical protein [Streptomyces sp. ERV7]OAR23752.1 hypothetical protein A8W25_14660 [Streptomyces sp. ERV7]